MATAGTAGTDCVGGHGGLSRSTPSGAKTEEEVAGCPYVRRSHSEAFRRNSRLAASSCWALTAARG